MLFNSTTNLLGELIAKILTNSHLRVCPNDKVLIYNRWVPKNGL